jgi:hypothetical protein
VHTDLDVTAFEHKELGRLGMPQGIMMRHRPAHFARKFLVPLPCRLLLAVLCGYGKLRTFTVDCYATLRIACFIFSFPHVAWLLFDCGALYTFSTSHSLFAC